jgi:signal transduction histidine kinase
MKRILSNLVANAVKYTPDDGQVSIEVAVRGELAEIRVRDSGPGIPADALEHIFERFYRADDARSREIAGAGLGLSIAKALAQANGGTIEVESTVGKGSCFTLKLPALGDSPP